MKPLAGLNEILLYLSFDGCLHSRDCQFDYVSGVYIGTDGLKQFAHVALLEEILKPFPEVKIVLSTSWVFLFGKTVAMNCLSPNVRKRVVGATFSTQMNRRSYFATPRGIQVLLDVEKRKPKNWLALDDDTEPWVLGIQSNFVQTNPDLGISDPKVIRLIRQRLERICRK
jgi:predicted thioredoxin/glutaredoxin